MRNSSFLEHLHTSLICLNSIELVRYVRNYLFSTEQKIGILLFAQLLVLSTPSTAQTNTITYSDGEDKTTVESSSGFTSVDLNVATGSATQSGDLRGDATSTIWTKTGSGILELSSNDNTYLGNTTISEGILNVTGSIASTVITVETGAGLTVDGASLLDSAKINFNGTGNLTLMGNEAIGTLDGRSSDSTISLGSHNLNLKGNAGSYSYFYGGISGTGGLTVDSSSGGYLIMTGPNTYTGTTTVNHGGLSLSGGQTIADTSAVIVNAGGALDIRGSETIGSLSGTGGVTYIRGGQTLTTNGSNGSNVYAGTLIGFGAGTQTFTKGGSDTLTLLGKLESSGGNLELNVGSGTLNLSNNSNSITSINVGSGTLGLGANGAAGGASGLITTTGSVIDYANGVNNPTAINVNSDTTQLQVTTGSATQSGVISETSGPRPLEKIGDGTLILSATNTYSGDTTVTGGILNVTGSIASTAVSVETEAELTVDGASLLDTAALTLNGTGNLTLTGSETIGSLESTSTTSTVILGSNTLTTGDANNTEFAGIMSGIGGINKTGSGTFELSGANTFTGATTVNSGVLDVTGSIASSTNIVNNAVLKVDGSSLLDTSKVILNSNGNLTLTGDETIGALESATISSTIELGSNALTVGGNGTNSYYWGSISGTGGLTKTGTGTLSLSPYTFANTYTGKTTVSEGSLWFVFGQAIADTGAVEVNGGSLTVQHSETIGALSGTGGAIHLYETLTTNSDAGSTEYAGNIYDFGSGKITKGGTSTLTLSGEIGVDLDLNKGSLVLSNNNNSTGAINVADGILRLEADGAAGGASGLITTTGSIIDYADGVNNPTAININSDTTQLQVTTGSAEQSGVISETSGSRPLEKIGGGTLVLSAANTYTGRTTVTGGILDVTGSIASTAITVGTGAGLQVDGSSLLDSARLTINGTGNLSLSGDEAIGTLDSASSSSTVSLGSSNLKVMGNSGLSSYFDGSISGTGGLTVDSSTLGYLNLRGHNTYTGTTTVNTGGLYLDGGQAIVDTSAVMVNGGAALQIGASETIGSLSGTGGVIYIENGQTLTTNGNTGPTEYAGSVYGLGTGTNTFTKAGSDSLTLSGILGFTGWNLDLNVDNGTLILSNNTNEITSIDVNSGTLRLEADGAAGGASGLITTTGSIIDYADGVNNPTAINVNSNTTQLQVTTGSANQSGVISETSGPRPLEKIGDGTLLLSAANTYTGDTTVTGGVLDVTGSVASTAVIVETGAGITVDGASLLDTAALTLNGTGNLTLTGSETIGSLESTSTTSTVILGSNTLTTGDANNTEFAGIMSGTGGLNKTGSGIFEMSGANTYTGDTTVTGGILDVTGSIASSSITVETGAGLQVDGSSLLDTAGVTLNGTGNLTLTGDETIGLITSSYTDSTISLGNSTLTVGDSDSTVFFGSISGTGGLTKDGSGSLLLYNTHTYTGTTTVNNGTLYLINGTTLVDTAEVVVNGGTLAVAGSETIGALSGTGGRVNVFENQILTTNGTGGATEYSGNLLGNGLSVGEFVKGGTDTLTLSGEIWSTLAKVSVNSGTLILTNDNNAMGAIDVNGGTLRLEANGAAGGATGLITTTGSVIDYADGINNPTAININSNTTQLQVTTGSAEQSGIISETSSPRPLEKIGDGTLVLSATNTYTGNTTVTAGILDVTGSIASTAVTVQSGAGLIVEGASLLDTVALTLNGTGNLALTGDETIGSLSSNASTSSIHLGSHFLTTGNTNNTEFAGLISGTGGLNKTGSGTLILSNGLNSMDYINVNGGTLRLEADGAAGGASGLITTAGSVIDYADGMNNPTAININSDTTQLQVTTGSAEQSGVISETTGPRPLEKIGAGTLVLSGANTYTGNTTVTGGILDVTGSIASTAVTVQNGAGLQVDGASLLDTAGVTLNGTGNLTLTGDETIGLITNYASTATVNLGSNTLTLDGSNFSSIYGSVSGTGGLTINGSSFLDLYGTNTYTGATTMNGGVIRLLGGQAIGDTSALIINDGQFGVGESETIGAFSGNGGRILISQNQTLTTNGNGGPLEYAGSIDRWSASSDPTNGEEFTKGGSDTLTLSGKIGASGYGLPGWGGGIAAVNVNSGTLILSNNDNHINAINLNGGTLRLEADGAAGGASGLITTKGSVIDYAGGVNNSTAINIHSNSALLQVNNATVIQSGVISETSGTRSLEKIGNGTLVLSAANTYTGETVVTGGILDITGSIDSSIVTVGNGTGLRVDGTSLLDTAAVSLNGSGNLTLTGSETIGFIFGSMESTVVLGDNTLTAGDSSFLTLGSVISGTGGLTKQGSGQLRLTGANTYTGNTTLNKGSLFIQGGQAIFDTAAVVVNTGQLAVESSETIGALSGAGGSVYMYNDQTLTTNGNEGPTEFSGTVYGGGTNSVFTKGGSDILTLSGIVGSGLNEVNVNAGTLILSNNSNSMDAINVAGGTLRLEADGAAGGASGQITTTGSVIDYADGVNIATGITVNSDTTQLQVTTGSATQSGIISEITGPRPLEKTGDGTLILSAVNTYTGDTTVTGGILNITGSIASTAVSVGSGAGLLIDGSSLLDTVALTLNGDLTTSANLTIASLAGSSATGNLHLGNYNLTTGASNSSTKFAGRIAGTGSFTKTGTGTQVLTGANTYTGSTTISGGVLSVTGSGSLLSTEIETLSGATFSTDGGALASDTVIVNSGFFDLTGSESIAKLNGSGTLSIDNGSLILNEGSSVLSTAISGTGGLTIQGSSNTRLSAANTYAGNTIVNSAGILTIEAGGSILSATTVTSGGTFNNFGSAGSVNNAGTSSNFGTIATLINTAGVFENDGTISGDTSILGGTLNNNTGASVLGNLSIGSAGIFNNHGRINSINNRGIFTSTGSIGAVTNSGTFTNSGTIASLINSSGRFNNNGTIRGNTTINGGTFNNFQVGIILGTTSVVTNGTLFNAGQVAEVNNAGSFTNTGSAGSVFNSGTSSNSGTIASFTQTGGRFSNSGSITSDLGIVAGTVTNQLEGTVGGMTIITTPGSLENAGTLGNVNNTGTFNNSGTAGSIYSTGTFTNTGTVAEITYAELTEEAQFTPQPLSIVSNSNSETVAQKLLNAGTVRGNLFLSSGTAEITDQGSVEGVTVVKQGARLFNEGTLGETQNEGTLTSTGTLGNVFNSGTTVNSGNMSSLTNTAGMFTHNSGTISGNLIVTGGTVDVLGGSIEGVTQNSGGTLMITGGNFSGDMTNFQGSTTLANTVQGNFLNHDLMTVSDSGTLNLNGSITNFAGATLELADTTASITTGLINLGITNAANANLETDITNAGQFDLIAGTLNGTFDNSGLLLLEDGTISGSLTNSAMIKAHGTTSIGGLISTENGFITMAGNGTGDRLSISGAVPNGGLFEMDLDLTAGSADHIDAGDLKVSGTVQFVFDTKGTGFISDPISILTAGSFDFELLYSNLPIGGLIDYTLESSSSGGIDLISQTNIGVGGIAASTSLMQSHISTVVNRPLSDFLRYQNAQGVTFQSGFARSTYGSATITSTLNNGVSDQEATFDLSYAGVQAGWDIVYNDARFFNGWNGSIGAMIGQTNGKSDQSVWGTIGNGEFHQTSITHSDFEQYYFSVYGSLNKKRWMLDAQLRMETNEFTLNEKINFGSGLGLNDTKIDNQTLSISNRISYLWQFSKNFELQPSIGISYARTSAGNVSFTDTQFLQVESFHSMLAFVGGVLSRKFTNQARDRIITLFAEGNYFKDLNNERSSFFTDINGRTHTITTGEIEGFGELGIGVRFVSFRRDENARIKSITGILRADTQFGDQLEDAINISGQLRFSF